MSEETDYLLIMPDSEAPVFNNYTVSIQVDEEDDEWELLSEPYSIEEDILVEFNVSASDNGEIVDYIWTFSDDSGSVNGQIITHRFADPGVYNISLEIVDSVGNKREVANSTISVSDETDPMSVIKPFDANGYTINEEFVLNATQSYDPRTDEDITEGLTFEWYVYEEGDDWVNQTLIGEEMVMNHSISEPGVYRINLTVTDSANNTGWSEKTLVINGIDLVVENLEFVSPDENDLKKGEKIKMSILIRNVGEVDAEDPIDIVLYRNTKVVKKTTLDDGLNAGKSHYWNFSFTPDYSGEYEWKVMIDPDNAIDEDTKDNNELSRPATIKETDSQLRDYWYVIPIIIVILIIVYVVYMKYTRGLWGYEPIVEWWNKRNN
jgi:PKD repeat protein